MDPSELGPVEGPEHLQLRPLAVGIHQSSVLQQEWGRGRRHRVPSLPRYCQKKLTGCSQRWGF